VYDSSYGYQFAGSQSYWGTPDQSYTNSPNWQDCYAILDDFSISADYIHLPIDDDADSSGDVYYKDVRIRKYAEPEPSVSSFGSEESSPVAVSFSITLNSPANGTTTCDPTPDFSFTVSGNKPSYFCELFINNTGYGTATANNNALTTITANHSLSEGTYNWYVNCSAEGVTNQSEIWAITISYPQCSNIGQNLTYVGMNESIELRAKWTPYGCAYCIQYSYYTDSYSVSSQDTSPTDIAFSSDGTKMYIVGTANDKVYQYSLSAPWDITTVTYQTSFSVSAQTGNPQGLEFSTDGTKMYICSGDYVYQYNLSTAWDISTATYSTSLDIGFMGTGIRDIAFSDDGVYLFLTGRDEYPAGTIWRLTLSTAWDISTADTGNIDYTYVVDNYEPQPEGFAFKEDGTKVYVVGSKGIIYQFTLSTAWDVTTISYDNVEYNVSNQDSTPKGMFFGNSGEFSYIVGDANDAVYKYVLLSRLDTAILYINTTGSFQAVDTIDLGDSATAKWSNFSYTPTTCNKVVGWKITANDSSGSSATTPIGTFYTMPYLYFTSNSNIINSIDSCSSKHNATITPIGTGDVNVTFLTSYFVRNATFKECSYEVTEDYDEIIITNTSEYCNITVINLKAENGVSFYLQDSTKLILNSPPDQAVTNDTTPDFNFTMIGGLSSYSCELFINDTGYGTATANNNTPTIITANQSLSYGTYFWYINCSVGNDIYQSEIREITISEAQPDIQYGLNPGITFRFPCNLNTGTTYGQPEGQNSTLASVWCYNNGTATGNFQARLNQSLPSGWWLFIANSSSGTKIELTTSWQTFYWNVANGTNITNCAWFWNNCSAGAGSPHPNVEIEFRAVS